MISLGHAVLFAALIASSTSQNAQEVGRATIITEDYLFCCSGWKYEKSGRSHFCTMNLEGVKQDIRNAVCKSLKGALRGDIEDEGTTICQIALKPDSTCAQTLNLNTTVKCDHQRVFSNRMVMRLPGGDFSKITIKVRGGKDQFHIRFTDGANDKKTSAIEIKSEKGSFKVLKRTPGQMWKEEVWSANNTAFNDKLNTIVISSLNWDGEFKVTVNHVNLFFVLDNGIMSAAKYLLLFQEQMTPDFAIEEFTVDRPDIKRSETFSGDQILLAVFSVPEQECRATIGPDLLMRIQKANNQIVFENTKTGRRKFVQDQPELFPKNVDMKMFFKLVNGFLTVSVEDYVIYKHDTAYTDPVAVLFRCIVKSLAVQLQLDLPSLLFSSFREMATDDVHVFGLLRLGEREEDDGVEAPSFEKLADEADSATVDPEVAMQSILDCILPPRRFEESGKAWVEHASTLPATRLDVLDLKARFEKTLASRGAKPFGICPIRRYVYDQLFDELIREVTVNCAERGVLLLRVRDELRLTLLSYQSLLESATAYGVRKAITVERQQTRAVVERDEEIEKNRQLEQKLEELEQRLASERLSNEEEMELLEQRMKDENSRLLDANKALKNQLQTILQLEESKEVEETNKE